MPQREGFNLEARMLDFERNQYERLDEISWVPGSAKRWSGSYDVAAVQFFGAARRDRDLDADDLQDLDLRLLAIWRRLYACALGREPSLH